MGIVVTYIRFMHVTAQTCHVHALAFPFCEIVVPVRFPFLLRGSTVHWDGKRKHRIVHLGK